MNEKRLLDQSEIFTELSKVLSLLSGDLSYDKRAEAKKIVGELLDASRESTVKESVQFITVDLAGDETKAVENEQNTFSPVHQWHQMLMQLHDKQVISTQTLMKEIGLDYESENQRPRVWPASQRLCAEKTCNEWKKDIDTDLKSILVKAVDEWFGCIFG